MGTISRTWRQSWTVVLPLAVADLEGDGDGDIVVADPETESVRVLVAAGGGFDAAGLVFPEQGDVLDLAVADIGGRSDPSRPDGLPDVIVLSGIPGGSAVNVLENHSGPRSADGDRNGVPDECERFLRGDFDGSGRVNVTDAIASFAYIFRAGAPPACAEAADAGDDGRTSITDGIAVLSHLFGRAPPLPPPYPRCGNDPTLDDLDCERPGACR